MYSSRFAQALLEEVADLPLNMTMGVFVWDQSGIRIMGIMRVSVCLGAIRIPEYLDFHSGYSAPWSRIAGIYSGIYSGIYFYSGISQTNAPYVSILLVWKVDLSALWGVISLHAIARFLFYHMDIFNWHSLKRHRNFQGISKFGSSRKTRISKTSALHCCVHSKFVIWRLPGE